MVHSRNKGNAFERTVAKMLRESFGVPGARRGLTQTGGALEPDVYADDWPFWTECKAHLQVNVQAALRQAERDVTRRDLPNPPPILVIARETGGDVFFALKLSESEKWAPTFSVEVKPTEIVLSPLNVMGLTPHSSWRTFRKALANTHAGNLLAVGGDTVVGWIEELETLWKNGKQRPPRSS